jgi:eukaryotic-like serine/threonine-protein kinase
MDDDHVPPGDETLGQYRLIAEIGRGGMAGVYLAVAQGLAGFNKLLVIKQLERHFAEDPEFLAMFLNEARLAARLSHANIVQTYQIGADGGQYFIAMEYLEGQSLHHVVRRLGRAAMPLGLHIRVLVDALAGLEYAHNITDYDGTPLALVHRDVSPQNVFVTYDGRVKLVDFGIAKALGSADETRNGVIKGKLTYMSPEQARCERVDRRSDVFSVGVMLWEALSQRAMWRGQNDIEILRRLQLGDIPPLAPAYPDLPDRLVAVCRKALAARREERYASAVELQAALEGVLEAARDKNHLRDLGKLASQAFETERANVQAVVESHFRGVTSPSGRTMNAPSPQDARLVPAIPPRATTASGRVHLTPSHGSFGRDTSTDMPVSTTEQRSDLAASIPSSQVPPRRPFRAALTLGLFLAGSIVVGFAGAALLFARRPAQTEIQTAPPVAPPAPSAARPAATATLKLDSTPAGATVTENGLALGTTPMTLPLADDQRGIRRFVVTLAGYQPYTLDQPAARDDVNVIAMLAPLPAAAQQLKDTPSPPARRPARAAATTPSAAAAAERPPPASTAAPGSIQFRTSR